MKTFNIKKLLFWIPAFAGMTVAAPSMAAPHAFPVPFVAHRHTDIKFKDLPGAGTLKIFNIAGEKVAELSIAPGESLKTWPVTNSSGKKLATGIYLFLVDAGGQRHRGKFVVIR